ncbi:unnamed protein product [Musa hybrid cultivar]
MSVPCSGASTLGPERKQMACRIQRKSRNIPPPTGASTRADDATSQARVAGAVDDADHAFFRPCTSLQNKRRFLHNQGRQLFSFSLVGGREEGKGLRMAWWERVVVFPTRRVWIGVATRLGVQRTGLKKLRKEVRTCEYEDVRVMWEILRKADSKTGRRPSPAGRAIQRRGRRRRRRRGHGDIWASLFDWAPCCLCRNL